MYVHLCVCSCRCPHFVVQWFVLTGHYIHWSNLIIYYYFRLFPEQSLNSFTNSLHFSNNLTELLVHNSLLQFFGFSLFVTMFFCIYVIIDMKETRIMLGDML